MGTRLIVQYEPPADGFQAFPLSHAEQIPAWLEEHALELADASLHFDPEPVVLVAYWRKEAEPLLVPPIVVMPHRSRTP